MSPDDRWNPIIAIHLDENGCFSAALIPDDVHARLVIVDESAPHDRVYEMTIRCTGADVAKLIGDDVIGSSSDGRHAAIEACIIAGLLGKSHLALVEHGGDDGS